jgi:hypothetical protein
MGKREAWVGLSLLGCGRGPAICEPIHMYAGPTLRMCMQSLIHDAHRHYELALVRWRSSGLHHTVDHVRHSGVFSITLFDLVISASRLSLSPPTIPKPQARGKD